MRYKHGILSYLDGVHVRILDVHNISQEEQVVDVDSLLAEEEGKWPVDQKIFHHSRSTYRLSGCQCTSPVNQALGKSCLIIHVLDCRHGILCFSIGSWYYGNFLVIVNMRSGVLLSERVHKIVEYHSWARVCIDERFVVVVARWKTSVLECALEIYDLTDKRRVTPRLKLKNNCNRRFLMAHYSAIHNGSCYALFGRPSVLAFEDDMEDTEDGGDAPYLHWYRFNNADFCRQSSLDKSSDALVDSSSSPLLKVKRFRRQELWRPTESCIRTLYEPEIIQDDETGNFTFIEIRPNDTLGALHPGPSYHFQALGLSEDPDDEKATTHEQTRDEPPHRCPPYKAGVISQGYRPTASALFEIKASSGKDIDMSRAQGLWLSVCPRIRIPGDSDGKQFKDGGVHQFPSKDAPEPLLRLLMPDPQAEEIINCAPDARSIIFYTANPDRGLDREARMVLLIFDPWISFPGLENLESQSLTGRMLFEEYETEAPGLPVRWNYECESDRSRRLTDEASEINAKASAGRGTMEDQGREGSSQYSQGAKAPWFKTEIARWSANPCGFYLSEKPV